jgi:hypothetical protein
VAQAVSSKANRKMEIICIGQLFNEIVVIRGDLSG